jgi:hypothetical protein
MVRRCHDETTEGFENYGGRGIEVCEPWRESFLKFLEDMGERPEGMTIDREDTNGNYDTDNCRWATPTQQSNNKRNNRLLTLNGKTQSASEWSKELGVPRGRLYLRVSRGWSDEEVLLTPFMKRRQSDG